MRINDEAMGALNMAVAERRRTIRAMLQRMTSAGMRQAYEAELAALEQAWDALKMAE